jgi:hypothetical protein
MKNLSRKAVVYTLIIAGVLVSVPLRIWQVERDRAREIVSMYEERKRNGKPVEAMIVQAKDVPVYAQFTVRSVDAQRASGFVTGDVKNALKEGQEVYDENKSAVCALVTAVGKDLDIGTGMFAVSVEFNQPVEPGRLFVVCCHTATLKNALVVSNEVLDIDNGDYFIWKAENGLAKRYKVTVGSRNGYGAVIAEGLQNGDTVIISGQSLLADNDKLLVRNVQ